VKRIPSAAADSARYAGTLRSYLYRSKEDEPRIASRPALRGGKKRRPDPTFQGLLDRAVVGPHMEVRSNDITAAGKNRIGSIRRYKCSRGAIL